MKNLIKNSVLRPPYVKWCSQTVYQSLLGCIKMYEYSKEIKWKKRAMHTFNILCKIQQNDGGFDIGYDFDFGMLHKKGESTSPEMVGLLAFVEYGRVFGFSDIVVERCEMAVNWIKTHCVVESEDLCYIPYAPYSTSNVMVYNGTSFVCGALGYYLGVMNVKDIELHKIYHGMINYLDSNLITDNDNDGRYWPYYDQKRTDIAHPVKGKIDNYHQMQQVEMHSYAQSVSSQPRQLDLILDASRYVLGIQQKNKLVPYTNNSKDFGGGIHIWGFSSIISGLIMARKNTQNELGGIEKSISITFNFIIENSWNGDYFYPVLDLEGKPKSRVYMVRSDAWVFNSLSSILNTNEIDVDRENLVSILDKTYRKMESVNFSGLESHSSNSRTRIISRLLKLIFKAV